MKTTDPADLRRLADTITWLTTLGLNYVELEDIRLALLAAADEIQGFRTGKCPRCGRWCW